MIDTKQEGSCVTKRALDPIDFLSKGFMMQRHSSHGVQYTPLQAESVNVITVKYGLDSAS